MSDPLAVTPASPSREGEAVKDAPVAPSPGVPPPHSTLDALRNGLKEVGTFGRWAWRFFNEKDAVPEGAAASQAALAPGEGHWLKSVLLLLRPAYRQTLLLSFFINFIALAGSVFSLQVYDRVVAHAGLSSLAALVIGMAVATTIDHHFRGGRAVLLQRMGLKIETQIARQAFERMLALPALQLEMRPPAYWQAVFRDLEVVRSTCSGATAMMLIDLPFLILSLILIGLIAWPILPVALAAVAVFMVLAWRSGAVTRNGAAAEREKLVARDATIAELAAARMSLKGLAADHAAQQRWESQYAHWMGESLARSRENDHYRDLAHALTTFTTVTMTSIGSLAILNNLMSMGALIASNILAGRLITPLVQLVGQWRSFGQFKAARTRLDALFNQPLDRPSSAISLPRSTGVLTLDGVSFRYPGSARDQVEVMNGQIGPGGLHAVVGANGSGKSTLLKLLRGLYAPATGRVLLDGADISQFSRADLAGRIGYLPQHVQLLSGSARDNITLSNPDCMDEDVLAASHKALAHDFLIDLPGGYGSNVGEGGARLSGGQRKRIGIAQVLLRDPPVLLLDEPTSDLDSEAEVAFCKTLRELAKDHTVLVVTHSPQLLLQCNSILLLDKGKLAAAGPAGPILQRLGLRARNDKSVVHVAA